MQQCIELRDTNNPIGLIFYFSVTPSLRLEAMAQREDQKISKQNEALKSAFSDALYVGIKESATFFDSDEQWVTSEENRKSHHSSLHQNFAPKSPAQNSGDSSAVAPPVPIPNTAVKRCSADGSPAIGRARVGRRQN